MRMLQLENRHASRSRDLHPVAKPREQRGEEGHAMHGLGDRPDKCQGQRVCFPRAYLPRLGIAKCNPSTYAIYSHIVNLFFFSYSRNQGRVMKRRHRPVNLNNCVLIFPHANNSASQAHAGCNGTFRVPQLTPLAFSLQNWDPFYKVSFTKE